MASVEQLQQLFEAVEVTNHSRIVLYGERSGILAARACFTLDYPDELRKFFAIPLDNRGPKVITYCRTGMQSSLDYFVAKYLGYAAAMYDGSFYEWSRSSRQSRRCGRIDPRNSLIIRQFWRS